MEKIVLRQEEIALIEKHLAGQYNPFFSSKEEQKMFNALIDKAEALEDELDAIDERFEMPNADLLAWYYMKYKDQKAQA